MTDERGPGWWLASDGKWYPPDQHPDPAHRGQDASPPAPSSVLARPAPSAPPVRRVLEPRPPKAPSTAVRVLSILGGLLLVVAAGVGAYAVAGGGDEGGTSSNEDENGEDDEDDEDDDSAPTETTEVVGTEASVDAGGDQLRLVLPTGWVHARPRLGPTADELFPDDPERRAIFDSNLLRATAGNAVLYAMKTDLETASELLVTFSPLADPVDLAQAIDTGRAVLETTDDLQIIGDEAAELAGGDGHIFRYEISSPGGRIHNVQVIVPSPSGFFVLVGQGLDEDAIDALAAVAPTIETD